MRILLTTDAVGGVWTFTRELTEGLLSTGCDVALASVGPRPAHAQSAWVQQVRDLRGSRFQFTAIDAPLEWMQENATAFQAAQQLSELALSFNADVIHSSQFCFGALESRAPVIITAHSDVLSWAASCRMEPLADTPWLRRYVELVSTGLTQAAALVAPTTWMLHALAANFRLPVDRRVISNGRSVQDVVSTERKLQAVSCGRLWDEGKNIGVLANVSSPMPILVAGDASHGDAQAPQTPGCAALLGVLQEAEMLALFQQSAIYLCTSRYEPFGLAPLEAALCGCAVVAYDIASVREVWGDSALFFHDAASLSHILQQLAEDPMLMADLQNRASVHAARYTRGTMTEQYLDLYRTCACAAEVSRAA